ncbi:hypothetical protein L208DRAFT_1274504, partial [Tricholoma matsutake]
AKIVSVDCIVQGCHLIGKANRKIDHGWTTDNVLEKATSFLVNAYHHVEMFVVTQPIVQI